MSARFPVSHSTVPDLLEDAKNLVRVDRSQGQIVIRVAAVVEVESAQHVQIEQPRHNLLDVLTLVMMARIHQHLGLRPGGLRKQQRHPPVGDIGVIKRRLEGLVLHQQALAGPR